MYLKNITLRGFKSFAKKSQLVFDKGISVIVGPNGSGKSNIVDAISWVLGSQSAKSLRGTSMDDIIFRSKQEELAIAEVSMLFDNSDKFLPLSFNEVKITRRVFQKGGSEYFINSSPSRLQDIQDITSEKGIGKGLYTIINQGQIDDIALLKPVERKILIDELIGIANHKLRRDKTKIKLEKVKNDVDRISDLMYEIKRTMDPLEVEAKKAQRYSETLNKLKEIEMELFVSDIRELNGSWDEKNKRYGHLSKELDDMKVIIKEIEKEKSDYEDEFGRKQEKFDEMKEKVEIYSFIENQIDIIKSMAESKRNVFSTIGNMLGLEYSNLKNTAGFFSEDIKAGVIGEGEADFYISKLDNIKEKILNAARIIKKHIIDSKIKEKFEKDISFLIEEISDLIKLIGNKDLNKNEKIVRSESSIKTKINQTREDIEKRALFIGKIQKYSEYNLLRAEGLGEITGRLKVFLAQQKRNFLKGHDELILDINSYNTRLNDYIRRISDINSRKQNYENEMYRIEVQKDQIKDNVRNLTENIIDSYNLPVEYIFKNYRSAEDIEESRKTVKRLKNEIKQFGAVNPNASIEFKKIKERYDFLDEQRNDLSESKNKLEGLIDEINSRIDEIFDEKFYLINENFNQYFKALFPLGNGEMILMNKSAEDNNEYGVDLKVDIGNAKMVPMSLLSGGEKALVSIAFLFSIFATSFSPFYVFDEIDASLDDMNLNRFILLVERFKDKKQIIIVTHQKKTMEIADSIYGVTMQSNSISKIVSEKVERKNAEIN